MNCIYHIETDQPVKVGDSVTSNRGRVYEVREVRDNGYIALYHEDAAPVLGTSDFAIRNFPSLKIVNIDDWFAFDLLKRERIIGETTVNGVKLAEHTYQYGWLYGEDGGGGLHKTDALRMGVMAARNERYLREPEFIPYLESGILHLQDQSIPIDSVGWCNGPYNTDTHIVVDHRSAVILKSDSVEIDGTVYHMSDTRTTHDGRVLPEWRTVEIDGELYDRNDVHRLINRLGTEEGWSVHEPEGRTFIESHDGWATDDYVVVCYGSDEYILDNDAVYWEGEVYSEEWTDSNTFVCDDCGERYHNDDYGSDGRCNECYNERCGDRRIRDYTCRDAADYPSEKNVPIKFGIELEVEPKYGNTQASLDVFDSVLPYRYAIYKSDGSLSDEGFEIVTRPDCPSVHKRIWDEALCDERVARTTTSWSSGCCGIHIHVSRRPLSDLWVGRMLVFINSPSMAPLIEKVAGRYNRGYCEIDHKKKLTDGKCGCGDTRYAALNTTAHKTIEFRIFRGTINRERFLKNIEFVEAVLAYCRPAGRSLRTIDDPDKFVAFVASNRKLYPCLHKLLIGELDNTGD